MDALSALFQDVTQKVETKKRLLDQISQYSDQVQVLRQEVSRVQVQLRDAQERESVVQNDLRPIDDEMKAAEEEIKAAQAKLAAAQAKKQAAQAGMRKARETVITLAQKLTETSESRFRSEEGLRARKEEFDDLIETIMKCNNEIKARLDIAASPSSSLSFTPAPALFLDGPSQPREADGSDVGIDKLQRPKRLSKPTEKKRQQENSIPTPIRPSPALEGEMKGPHTRKRQHWGEDQGEPGQSIKKKLKTDGETPRGVQPKRDDQRSQPKGKRLVPGQPTTSSTSLRGANQERNRKNSMAEPIVGRIYQVQYEQRPCAVVLLPLQSLEPVTMVGTLAETGLDPPSCYKQGAANKYEWASRYEDGGERVSNRKYPVLFLEPHFRINTNSAIPWEPPEGKYYDWFKKKDLTPVDMDDPASRKISGFKIAKAFLQRMDSMRGRNNAGGTGGDTNDEDGSNSRRDQNGRSEDDDNAQGLEDSEDSSGPGGLRSSGDNPDDRSYTDDTAGDSNSNKTYTEGSTGTRENAQTSSWDPSTLQSQTVIAPNTSLPDNHHTLNSEHGDMGNNSLGNQPLDGIAPEDSSSQANAQTVGSDMNRKRHGSMSSAEFEDFLAKAQESLQHESENRTAGQGSSQHPASLQQATPRPTAAPTTKAGSTPNLTDTTKASPRARPTPPSSSPSQGPPSHGTTEPRKRLIVQVQQGGPQSAHSSPTSHQDSNTKATPSRAADGSRPRAGSVYKWYPPHWRNFK